MTPAEQYEFLVCLLFAIVLLELLARKLSLPPAAAFILGGIALALLPGVPTFDVDPDLVLLIFLPPLLMNGAYFTVWREFRKNLGSIALLALGAVAFTTFAVGMAARWLVPDLPWAVCFALGAIVSPPDAVAAEAILERLTLPDRLSALLQGESLLNDASGLVLFRFAVAAALTGTFSATAAIGSFLLLTLGGVVVGLLVGWIGLLVLRRLDGELATTATLLLTIVSYVGGERLHVSGVLATVATGMLIGWHQHSVLNAGTRVRTQAFWQVLVFLLESLLFILIGLSLRGVLQRFHGSGEELLGLAVPVAGVVAVVILSRFLWMFGSALIHRLARWAGLAKERNASLAVATVMSWAGMRGVVTLAAALSLPKTLPGRDFILLSAFAVILVTVLVQGTTLAWLIGVLRLTGPGETRARQESEDFAWMQMTAAQSRAIAAMSRQADGSERHPRLVEQFQFRARVAAQYTEARDAHKPEKDEHFATVIKVIEAGREEVLALHRAGRIHDRVLRSLEQDLDLQQMVAESHTE